MPQTVQAVQAVQSAPAPAPKAEAVSKPSPAPQREAVAAPSTAKEEAADADANFDLEELWMHVFEEGESEKPSFNMLRTKSNLEKIGKEEFYISVENKFVSSYAFENRDLIEGLMESFTGKRRRMHCMVKGGDAQGTQPDAAQMKESLESLTGISIEIED